MLPAILELPRAHQQQLATGTGIEELLVGLVGGILRDALRKEGNKLMPLLHHSSRYGSLAWTDAGRDGHHTVLTGLEHLGFQGFHSGLRHRARTLYLHTLRSVQQAKVAHGAEGDRLGRWCGASWSCGTLSIWLRVRDRLQQALYWTHPATTASGATLCQHGHGKLDATYRMEVLAVVAHHPKAARVVTTVVDHPLQLPLPEEDAVVEARLEDEADLGVLTAMARARVVTSLLYGALSPRLRGRDSPRLRGRNSPCLLVAQVHQRGGWQAEGDLLVGAVDPTLELVDDDAEGALLGEALLDAQHHVKVVGHHDALEDAELRIGSWQALDELLDCLAKGVEGDVGIVGAGTCQLTEEVRTALLGVCLS